MLNMTLFATLLPANFLTRLDAAQRRHPDAISQDLQIEDLAPAQASHMDALDTVHRAIMSPLVVFTAGSQ